VVGCRKLPFDALVSSLWQGYAKNGKEATTVRMGLTRAGTAGPRRLCYGTLLPGMSRCAVPDWRRSVPLCPSSPRFLKMGPSHKTTGDALRLLQHPRRLLSLQRIRILVSAARP
jgi:hypothetical protein